MATCRACGGVLGRDCFNEQDCLMILHSRQPYDPQEIEMRDQHIAQLEKEIAELKESLRQGGSSECSSEALELLAIIENADFEEGGAAVFELRKLLPNLDKFITHEIEDARHGGWIAVSSGEFPKIGETVLMWFVTVDPRNSGPVLGSLSLHEPGKYWYCSGLYRDFSHISHWKRIEQPAPLSPAAIWEWQCETCGTRFPEYVNGCPHCWEAGIRSGVRNSPAPPAPLPPGETR
jgi:hypothetical protein